MGTILGGLLILGVDDPDAFTQTAMMGREAESEQLTGRIPLWEYTMEEISKRPWTGYGFNSYWTEDALDNATYELEWAVPNAHNSFIEMALSLGLIGVLLLIAAGVLGMLAMATGRVRRRDPAYAFLFGLAIFGMFNCFMESYMVAPFNFHPLLVATPIFRLAFYED